MKEAEQVLGQKLYDEACRLDAEASTYEDEKSVLALLKKAVSYGCRAAFEMFAVYNLMGWGMSRPNYRKAGRFFESAAQNDNFSSFVDLAWCYYYGHGVPRRRRKAFLLYRKAAMEGSIRGICNVASFYDYGEKGIVKRDFAKAFRWYMMAAEKGAVDAMFKVAYAYDTGRGVKCDKRVAVECYRKAAKKGSADALWNLSVFYESGLVVRRNCKYAQRLREMAVKAESEAVHN